MYSTALTHADRCSKFKSLILSLASCFWLHAWSDIIIIIIIADFFRPNIITIVGPDMISLFVGPN